MKKKKSADREKAVLMVAIVLVWTLVAALVGTEVYAVFVGNETEWGPWGECDNGLPGDANCSGVVDIFDYWDFVLPSLYSVPGDDLWRPGADLSRDGRVNERDEAIVSRNLGRTLLHQETRTGKGQAEAYWAVSQLADGTPWPLTFCIDSGACWVYRWNEYGWYEWQRVRHDETPPGGE